MGISENEVEGAKSSSELNKILSIKSICRTINYIMHAHNNS